MKSTDAMPIAMIVCAVVGLGSLIVNVVIPALVR